MLVFLKAVMWSRTFLICWFTVTISLCVCALQDGSKSPDNRKQTEGSNPPTSNGKSAQMCKKYAESVFYTVDTLGPVKKVDVCARIESLIIGGAPAQPREFPHMALIGFPKLKGGKRWTCGGSLISERFVLSVAHCGSINKVRAKWIRLGEYDYKSTTDDEENDARPVDYDIIDIITHPEYDAVKNYNDIALYKLDKNVVFNEYIRPICLHTEHQLSKSLFIVSGWWSVAFGEPPTGALLKSDVSYVPKDECKSKLSNILERKKIEIRDNTMLCAANFDNSTENCQGSSGAPLLYPLSEPYCMYSQVGITSFGYKCGDVGEPKFPTVYTRVSNFVPWIESIVWP